MLSTVSQGVKTPGHKGGSGRILAILFALAMGGAGFAGGFYYHKWKTSTRVSYPATCIRVLDADTIEVEWALGRAKVRLAGVDAPEGKDNKKLKDQAKQLGTTPENLLQVSKTIINQAEIVLPGRKIKLVFPRGDVERDSFGRLLAYVEVGNADFGAMLLRNGLVYPRPEPHPRKETYLALNEQAVQARKGLYGLN